MTSPKPPSTTSHSRAHLTKVFWECQVMKTMRTGQHVVYVHIPPPLAITSYMFGDDPPSHKPDLSTIAFTLWTFRIGQEPWAAVICDGRTIIPPFPFFGYDQLPLRPESIPRV